MAMPHRLLARGVARHRGDREIHLGQALAVTRDHGAPENRVCGRSLKAVERFRKVGDRQVSLKKIDMPLNLLAGATDHITPPDQVFALATAAATPAEEVLRDTTAGGHLGLFMGHAALREHWPPLLEAVRRHSTPKHPDPGRSAPKSPKRPGPSTELPR